MRYFEKTSLIIPTLDVGWARSPEDTTRLKNIGNENILKGFNEKGSAYFNSKKYKIDDKIRKVLNYKNVQKTFKYWENPERASRYQRMNLHKVLSGIKQFRKLI